MADSSKPDETAKAKILQFWTRVTIGAEVEIRQYSLEI